MRAVNKSTHMKNLILTPFLLVSLLIPAFAQTNCEGYYPFEKGVFYQQSFYDSKGKLSTVSDVTIDEVKAIDGGWEAHFQTVMTDAKGKESGTGQYSAQCIDGMIIIDVKQLLSSDMLAKYEDMDVSFSGEGMRWPNQLAEGQELPGGNTHVEIGENGFTIVTIDFEVTDRKVLGKETIDTPIGPYECFKVTETINYKVLFSKQKLTSVSWYAKNKGLMRQESFDSKGNPSSTMEMTKWGKK